MKFEEQNLQEILKLQPYVAYQSNLSKLYE